MVVLIPEHLVHDVHIRICNTQEAERVESATKAEPFIDSCVEISIEVNVGEGIAPAFRCVDRQLAVRLDEIHDTQKHDGRGMAVLPEVPSFL